MIGGKEVCAHKKLALLQEIMNNEKKRNQYWERKNAGMCTACGAKPARNGKTRCEECAKKQIEYQKENRKFWREQGLCVRCGKYNTYGDSAYCVECQAKIKNYHEKEYNSLSDSEKKKIAKNRHDYQKERRKGLKNRGICSRCAKRKAKEGHVLCHICLEKNRIYAMENRGNIPRYERHQYGLCYICGEKIDGNMRICNKCSDNVSKNLPKKKGNDFWRNENKLIFGMNAENARFKKSKESGKKLINEGILY